MNGKELIHTVQHRLRELGYYHGFLDGLVGPLTSHAIITFKESVGLKARDYIGPLTMSALFNERTKPKTEPEPDPTAPPWLVEARSFIGTKEYKGSADNPTIMQWATNLDQWYPGDDIPWCGLFVAHCMDVGAPDGPQDFNRLGARNWLEYGKEVPASLGAIAVFWRTHPTRSWNGHVGFLVGEDRGTYHILGGNQSDSVNITRISKDRLLGFRGPTNWEGDTNLSSVAGGTISTNEG